MSDFYKRMKKNRGAGGSSLRDKIEKDNERGGSRDENEWTLQRDKASNGFAIIRFLPATEKDVIFQEKQEEIENAVPWVLIYKHGFKVNGRWFINECPRTIGGDCPVCEAESELVEAAGGWDLPKTHPARMQYADRKGKKSYYANIYVVQDSQNPENEGKVFTFRFGWELHQKIISPLFPEFEDETAFNPFDPWEGADFKLKVRKDQSKGFLTYDKSEYVAPAAISDDDDDIIKILEQSHFLGGYLDHAKYKSYEDMEKFYQRTLGTGTKPARQSVDDDDDSDQEPVKKASKIKEDDIPFEDPKKGEDNTPFDTDDGVDSDAEAYFQSILDD